jgi:dienelactone hydrolase
MTPYDPFDQCDDLFPNLGLTTKTNHMFYRIAAFVPFLIFMSCNDHSNKTTTMSTEPSAPQIKEEALNYSESNTTYKNYVYYDAANDSARPAVLVIPEWWGINDYPRMRAKQLAELGYIAMAVDMYGNGDTASNPQEATAKATPFYNDPNIALTRINAALQKLSSFKQADTSRMAAIGYCFGGTAVLNAAKLGANLKGVVSFHGDFPQGPIDRSLFKASVLICHGADDKFVPESSLNSFRQQLDSAGVPNIVKVYPGATHAFSNPNATSAGEKFKIPIAYNEAADKGSWNEMKTFFSTIF